MDRNKYETDQVIKNEKQQEKLEEQRNFDKFNSVTQKKKPENQNQEHNVRKEGIGKINQLK